VNSGVRKVGNFTKIVVRCATLSAKAMKVRSGAVMFNGKSLRSNREVWHGEQNV